MAVSISSIVGGLWVSRSLIPVTIPPIFYRKQLRLSTMDSVTVQPDAVGGIS
jgi:hypothetical protein